MISLIEDIYTYKWHIYFFNRNALAQNSSLNFSISEWFMHYWMSFC